MSGRRPNFGPLGGQTRRKNTQLAKIQRTKEPLRKKEDASKAFSISVCIVATSACCFLFFVKNKSFSICTHATMKRSHAERTGLCVPQAATALSAAASPTAKRRRDDDADDVYDDDLYDDGDHDDDVYDNTDAYGDDGDDIYAVKDCERPPLPSGDLFERLPDEILYMLFNGVPDRGRFYLEPRWRAVAAMTCRRWRRILSSPSLTAVALLERARPHRASPVTWSRGRAFCASALRDAVALLPSDTGVAYWWLALVPDRCSEWPGQRTSDALRDDLTLGTVAAVMASGNLAAMRDAWSRHLAHPHIVGKAIVGDWFDVDEAHRRGLAYCTANLGDAMLHAACRAARPTAALWLIERCEAALTLSAPMRCDMLALLADVDSDNVDSATKTFDVLLGLGVGRPPWREALYVCLQARSHEASDLLATHLFAMVDRGTIVVETRETAARARTRKTMMRTVDFVVWNRQATAWCAESFFRDRPRVAAAAIARWGVPTLAPTAYSFNGVIHRGDDTHGDDSNDYDDWIWQANSSFLDDTDDFSLWDEDEHRPASSQAGFWEAALAGAIAGGATASIAWLLAEGAPAGAIVTTPAAALAILLCASYVTPPTLRALDITPAPCALDILSGARVLARMCEVARPPTHLLRAAMRVCARGFGVDRAAHALFIVSLGLWPDHVATCGGDIDDALCGLLHAQVWSAVDAAVDALDRASPGLFDDVDLWRIGALGHHGLLGRRTTDAAFDAPSGLAFLALRVGALAPETICIDIDTTVRRHPLAPAIDCWRRWCRPRPVTVNRCAAAGEVPDGAWTTLEGAGLLCHRPMPCDDGFCNGIHTADCVYA